MQTLVREKTKDIAPVPAPPMPASPMPASPLPASQLPASRLPASRLPAPPLSALRTAEFEPQRKSFSQWLLSNCFFRSAILTTILDGTYCLFGQSQENWQTIWVLGFVLIATLLASVSNTTKFLDRKAAENKATNKATNNHSIFAGASGKSVMIFGVVIPLLITGITSFLASLSFCLASCQYIASLVIPLGIFLAWQELRAKKQSFPSLRRFAISAAVLYQAVVLISCYCTSLKAIDAGATILLVPMFSLFLASLALCVKLWKQADTATECKAKTITALAGASLLFLAPSTTSIITDIRVLGMTSDQSWVNKLAYDGVDKDAFKKDLESVLNITSVALFRIPLPAGTYEKAYYQLTGEDYRQNAGRVYVDDVFYGAPIIGSKPVPGLAMKDSELIGKINSKYRSASFDWSFDFENDISNPGKEARLEILLPKNSAITNLQLMPLSTGASTPKNLAPAHPLFSAKTELYRLYSNEAKALKDPVLATMISSEKVLLQSAPILKDKPVRVKMHIVAPFATDAQGRESWVTLPSIARSNASTLASGKVRIVTDTPLLGEKGNLIKSGDSWTEDFSKDGKSLKATLNDQVNAAYKIKDSSGQSHLIQRTFQSETDTPHRLVIAIDGSVTNIFAKEEIRDFVKKLPKAMTSKILFASPHFGTQDVPLKSASEFLSKADYVGGDKNWNLLKDAIVAAKQNHSDVFWIHSQKPWNLNYDWVAEIGFNSPVPYNLAELCAKDVKIYDFQTTAGENELKERINANGDETVPFVELRRHADVASDLAAVTKDWTNKSNVASVKFVDSKAANGKVNFVSETGSELTTLANAQQLSNLVNQGKRTEAEKFATSHNMMSIYTGALCLESEARPISLPSAATAHQSTTTTQNPVQPIMYQADATVIQGVNTAGTVRVNNLANLEALLNIICNGFEIFGLAYGFPMMIIGFMNLKSKGSSNRICMGIALITGGLATPGVVNWFVASSRDSGGFS